MNKWNNISLFQFQQIDEIINRDIDELDKILFQTCVIFGLTEFQLDNMPPAKAAKLMQKVSTIYTTEFPEVIPKKIGKYLIEYDPSKMTMGQYVEVSFFISSGHLKHAHYLLASISRRRFCKRKPSGHKKRADYFLTMSIVETIGAVKAFIANLEAFNAQYKNLFGLDAEVNGEGASSAFFNRRYGWTYSVSQIADYEKITLDEAFNLPVRQGLNDLNYLKEKGKYEAEQLKKK
jgi:hypothetical protein